MITTILLIRKNVKEKSKDGRVTPQRVIQEVRRLEMKDKIKNTPAGQRFAIRAKARLAKRKIN